MHKINESIVRKILILLDQKERVQMIILFFFILIGVAFETVGIGVFIPFINIISDTNAALNNKYIKIFVEFFRISSHEMLVLYASLGMIFILVLKNIMLYFIFNLQTKFTFRKQASLATQLFGAYLRKTYGFFSEKNSAEFQRNINGSVPEVVNGVIFPAMLIVSESLITMAIFILLLWTDWISSLSVLGILAVTTAVYYKWSIRRIAQYTKIRNEYSTNMIKWVNQGVGGIKEIRVLGRERYFYEKYFDSVKKYVDISCKYQIITFVPRLYFESVTIIALVLIVLLISLRGGDTISLIPILGLFAMAAFRILPALNRITTLHNSIRYYVAQLDNVVEELIDEDTRSIIKKEWEENSSGKAKGFSGKITIEKMSFRYPNVPTDVIQDVNLDIKKGETIGFIGISGAGKSTLIDLILGLLQPTSGCIKVDNVNIKDCMSEWQKMIGYIPQTIYLMDDSVSRNIALGVEDEKIDKERVWQVLELAQMKESIENLPGQLDAVIGELGARLSGGQRQRIGIARALYHNPEILILDEATSALDMETERRFSEAIESLSGTKTILIIAHRMATLEKCDKIYEVKQGKLLKIQNSEHSPNDSDI
ncbi:ABC transporter ATP-binding protein [Anaeroarcus burkinensis]|uniref:ABC transporter ATP-binding protein n=1 Tax=Anaeroarcus burkinensis TaxID=82376 RepID=UPI000486A8AA|nr:ABC transporter ATP-binding protein [Anaeroarcus burkinensis]